MSLLKKRKKKEKKSMSEEKKKCRLYWKQAGNTNRDNNYKQGQPNLRVFKVDMKLERERESSWY